jgi:hypothetical protein
MLTNTQHLPLASNLASNSSQPLPGMHHLTMHLYPCAHRCRAEVRNVQIPGNPDKDPEPVAGDRHQRARRADVEDQRGRPAVEVAHAVAVFGGDGEGECGGALGGGGEQVQVVGDQVEVETLNCGG